MKSIIIVLFCLASGFSLGSIAGTSMSMAFTIDLPAGPYIGAIMGGLFGLLLSPFFILRKVRDNKFEILVLCFTLAFPVALISGLTRIPWLSIGLTLATILSVFIHTGKKVDGGAPPLYSRKSLLIFPLIAIIFAVFVAYKMEDKTLPDNVPALIELMGDNDLSIHTAAARKLMKHGKEPFLSALHHKNPSVRAVAAHFLGLLHDPTAQDALIKSSRDPDHYVRMWSAFSLGEIGSEKALPVLELLMRDKENVVRLKAEESISKIKKRQ
jgi:hypothetical protein